jgi:predicted kinase
MRTKKDTKGIKNTRGKIPMRKNTLIMLAGISGSGKSTFRELLCESNHFAIVCPDLIRKELYGDESIQGDGNKVFSKAFEDLQIFGDCHFDCVFDATNTTKKARKQVIEHAKEFYNFILCYYFSPDLDKSIINQAKRERQVPREVLARQINQWETPTIDEGFDYVCEIKY